MRPLRAAATLALTLGVLLGAVAGQAQAPRATPRVGLLTRGVPGPANIDALLRGLRELGYVEGQNIIIESRYTEGRDDRLPALAADLVRARVDVIVAWEAKPSTPFSGPRARFPS